MSILSFADGRLIAQEMGSAPDRDRVVYLHGWGRDRTDWAKIAERVAGLAVDLPGFGSSARPTVAMGAHDYGELIRDLIGEWADGEPVIIVGHSFGGRVAIATAADHPKLVDSLVVAGTPLFRPQPRKQSLGLRLAKLANRIGVVSDAKLEQERLKRGSPDYRNAQGVMRDCFVKLVNEDYRTELEQLTQPTTFIWGVHDTAAKLDDGRQAAEIVKGAHLVELDASHDVHLERPDEFAAEIRKLVDR